MPNTSQDTEITLGTGRMLALFFALVVICAAFFAIGFSLGRKASAIGSGNVLAAQSGAPSSVIRPPAGKNNPTPTPASTDFSFYNAVGQKTAESKLTPPSETQKKASSSDTQAQPGAATNSDQSKTDQSKTDQPKTDQPANL